MDGGAVRRAPGRRGGSAGGLPRRQGPARADGPSASGRPGPGWPGPAGHRRAGRRGTDVAARSERLRRRRHVRGREAAVGLVRPGGRQRACGTMPPGTRCSVQQVRLAREAGALDQLPIMLGALGTAAVWSGDFAAGRRADRGGGCGLRGDRKPCRPVRRDDARVTAGRPGRGRPADRGHHRPGRGRGTGNRGGLRALGGRHPGQRPRPLRGGAGGGPAGQRGHVHAVISPRGRCPSWSRRPRAPATPRWRPTRWIGWRRRPRPAGPTSGWASRRAAARCSAAGRPPTSCTARRSTGWAGPGCARSWPARTCSTGSGCAARAGASTRASSCARRTTCSPRSAWRRSPSAPAGS